MNEYFSNCYEVSLNLWNIKERFALKDLEVESKIMSGFKYDPYKYIRGYNVLIKFLNNNEEFNSMNIIQKDTENIKEVPNIKDDIKRT